MTRKLCLLIMVSFSKCIFNPLCVLNACFPGNSLILISRGIAGCFVLEVKLCILTLKKQNNHSCIKNSLHCRSNLTSVSNVCEAVLISMFWVPNDYSNPGTQAGTLNKILVLFCRQT